MTDTPQYATGAAAAPVSENASRRPGGLAIVVICALALTFVVAIWALVVRFDRASYVSHLINGSIGFDEAQATAKDDRVRGALIAIVLTNLATAAAFITWFALVVRRLYAVRPADFRHGRGWAIGAWFVPVLNLVYPKQMVDDAWRAATARTRKVPAAFHFWWAFWLLGNLVIFIADEVTRSNDPNVLAGGDRAAGVGYVIYAIGAILGIVVVAMLDVAAQATPQPLPSAWPQTWPQTWPAQQAWPPPAAQPPAVAPTPPALRFNPPPGWPAPPPGWVPPPDWHPDPSWPSAPEGWTYWVPNNPE